MSQTKRLRWGIIGCGKISFDFVNAVRHLPDVLIAACSARSLLDAAKFGAAFSIPENKCYGSYEELLKDADVDVVYIGTIHTSHVELGIMALQHHKHVLVEKPIAINLKQTQLLIQQAKISNKFIMEAMWSRFCPAIRKVHELIGGGVLGDITLVTSQFGFLMHPDTPRLWQRELGGGATLDLGVYPVGFAHNVFGRKSTVYPTRIHALGQLSSTGIDQHVHISLDYGSNQFASIQISFMSQQPNETWVIGTKGRIHIPGLLWHCAQKFHVYLDGQEQKTYEFPLPARPDQYPFNFFDSQLLMYECIEVQQCISQHKVQSEIMPWHESETIMTILDEIRKQVGVIYPEDE